MPSRKRRKRHRAETTEATGKTPGYCGGWGRGVPVDRADIAMIRRAIREGWASLVTCVADVSRQLRAMPMVVQAAVPCLAWGTT